MHKVELTNLMERPIHGFNEGDGPLQLNVLHGGTEMPDGICGWLMVTAQRTPDTDWYIPQLYDFAGGLGATAMGHGARGPERPDAAGP